MHEAGHRAPGRRHRLRAGPPVPDVPGLAVLLLAQGSHLPDHSRVLRAVLPRRPQILRGLHVLRRIRQDVGPAAPADALPTRRRRGGCLSALERTANANRPSSRRAELALNWPLTAATIPSPLSTYACR